MEGLVVVVSNSLQHGVQKEAKYRTTVTSPAAEPQGVRVIIFFTGWILYYDIGI